MSNIELTFLDLIYFEQSVGGYNRIISILEELSESINLTKMKEVVKNDFPLSVFQRAGFIAENVLANTKLAAIFENKLTKLNPKTVLLKSSEEKNGEKNAKWNLIINNRNRKRLMIPRAHIIEWQKMHRETNAQVEQDLVIERALVELFSDDFIRENLAFRGGTALHKMFFKPQARYSEDIDLVQIKPGNIHPILQQIRKKLDFLGQKRSVKANEKMNTVVYRFDTEIQPVINSRLKVEINCREHFNVFGLNKVAMKVDNSWFSGETEINTYSLEELLGTKMRALYQRKKDVIYSIYIMR